MKKIFLLLVLSLAFLINLLVIFPSGSYLCYKNNCGLYFWGANEIDGIWHLSIINSSFYNFKFLNPLFYGSKIGSYNFLLDFIIHLISKIGISSVNIYFKILPIIWFFLMVYLINKLTVILKKSFEYKILLIFMIFLGTSFSYFFTLFHNKTINGSSGLLIMSSALSLINLQFAFSLVLFLIILILINSNLKDKYKNLFLFFIVFFSYGLKFYSGIIFSFFILINSLINFFKNSKKNNLFISIFFIIFATLFAYLIFYKPFIDIKNSQSVFIFKPLANVHPIIEEKNLFYLKDLVNARYFILNQQKLGLRFFLIELLTLSIFIFFNFGTRIFGIFFLIFKLFKKNINDFDLSIFLTIIFSVFLSTMLIQRSSSGWWNTIQFLYYGIFLSNFLLADFLINFKNKLKYFLIVLVIILNIPINIDILLSYSNLNRASYLEKEELEALNFLKKQPYGVVYSLFFNDRNINNTNNLRYKLDTPYISAISHKPSYLSSIGLLDLVGINFNDRLKRVKENDCQIFKNIDYIYQVKKENDLFIKKCNLKLSKIFENSKVSIFKLIN